MRRSEQILLAILVGGLLLWQGGRLVNRLMFDPVRQSRAELVRLDEQIAEQKDQAAEFSRAASRLEQWQQRSLPPDALTAQRLYQQWLTDLARDCGFAALRVFPDRVTRKSDTCVGVLVSVDAEARLRQVCLFLHRFYRTDLAQQITLLSMDSTQDDVDPKLQVRIIAEGLSMRDAPQRQRLFPTSTLVDVIGPRDTTIQIADGNAFPTGAGGLLRIGHEYLRVVKVAGAQCSVERGFDQSLPLPHPRGKVVEFIPVIDPTADATRSDFSLLVAQDPFGKLLPEIAKPLPRVDDEPPEIDPAEFTYLIAAFAEEDKREAWLYDRLNDKNIVIDLGAPFSIAGIEGFVRVIGDGFVVLDYGDSRWRLRLGKNLRSMERISRAIDDAAEPTDER